MRSRGFACALLVVLGIACHAALFRAADPTWRQSIGRFYVADPFEYAYIAQALVEHGEFRGYGWGLIELGYSPEIPNYIRPPLYPIYLAAILKAVQFASAGKSVEDAYRAAPPYFIIAHIVLHLSTTLALFLTLTMIAPVWVAFIAAVLVMFEPNLIALNYALWSENLFVPLTVLLLYAIIAFWTRRSARALLLAGLCAGVCALVKPVGLLYAAALPIMTLGLPGRRLRYLGAAVGCMALVLAPYTIRNYAVWGDLRLTAQPSFALYFNYLRELAPFNGAIMKYVDPDFNNQWKVAMAEAEREGIVSPDNFNGYRLGDHFAKKAIAILNEGFWADYAKAVGWNMGTHFLQWLPFAVRLTRSDPPAEELSGERLYPLFEAGFFAHRLLFLPLALVGLVLGFMSRGMRGLCATVGVTWLAFIFGSAPINDGRTCVPELVLLCPYVAIALSGIAAWLTGEATLRAPKLCPDVGQA